MVRTQVIDVPLDSSTGFVNKIEMSDTPPVASVYVPALYGESTSF